MKEKLLNYVIMLCLFLLQACGPSPQETATQTADGWISTPISTSILQPTANPTATPEEPTRFSVWDLTLHITTTSDWTTIRLSQGATIGETNIRSVSQEAETAQYDQDHFQLSQPIDRAEAGKSIEMLVDISLDRTGETSDLVLEIDRGFIGATTVEVFNYTCGQPNKVATLTWDGVKAPSENVERFNLPFAQTTNNRQNEYVVIAQMNFWFNQSNPAGNGLLLPYLGRYSSDDSEIIYQQIEWASQYGIDAFSVEWTTSGPGGMEDMIDNVFLTSSNINKIRWVIFYDFILRLDQTPGLQQYLAGQDIDFSEPAVHDAFVDDFRHFAEKYFENPQYLTIDGRPVIYIWSTWRYAGDIAGALRDARAEVAKLGYDVFIVGDEITANSFDAKHAALFDGNSTFTFLIPGLNIHAWNDVGDAIPEVDQTFERWRTRLEGLKIVDRDDYVNFQPAWTPQYDERRWIRDNPIYVPATSMDQAVAMAETVRKHAQPVGSLGQKLIWVNTWNNWAEMTTIEPTKYLDPKYPAGNYYFDMLEIVRDVFGVQTFACYTPPKNQPAPPTPQGNDNTAFDLAVGEWESPKADGSNETLHIEKLVDNQYAVTWYDDSAPICGVDAQNNPLSGIQINGQGYAIDNILTTTLTLTCLSTSPKELPLYATEFIYDISSDTLKNSFGMVWTRKH